MKLVSGLKAWMLCTFLLAFIFTACKKNELTPNEISTSTDQTNSKNGMNHFDNWQINTIAGSDIFGYTGDGGPASEATFNSPGNVYVDKWGNIFISDLGNNVIRKIDVRTGIINTVAGNGIFGYSGDGGPATEASLGAAFQTAVDHEGNLIISDLANNRIRRVDRFTGIITTLAGTGNPGYNGDGHKALETDLFVTFGVVFDNMGNLIFSDGSGLRIRKMDMRTKIITTVAGNGERGFSGDGGPATMASLNFVWNLALDHEGNIYFGDAENLRVRRVDTHTGIISTIAGNGIFGNSGIGGPAKDASFEHPVGITFDNQDNLFISDEVLSQVYMIDKHTGILNLIAGNGTNGFYGDGGPASQALLFHPNSISADNNGNIYISDNNNNRTRKLFRGSKF